MYNSVGKIIMNFGFFWNHFYEVICGTFIWPVLHNMKITLKECVKEYLLVVDVLNGPDRHIVRKYSFYNQYIVCIYSLYEVL